MASRFVIVLALAALCVVDAAKLRQKRDPEGPGNGEPNMGLACQECDGHKQYLKNGGDECVCFATDIAGTFENDATKTSTKRTGSTGEGSGEGTHSFEDSTSNIGAARLAESWMWHCRPITDGTNPQGDKVWQQC